jgi:ubiquitin-conjugating enzyme E2 variant
MDMGLILSKKEHGQHHTAPFDTNYCILTGQNNKWLDESHFFRRLERIVYDFTGNEANTWNEEGGDKVRARAMEM